MSRGYRDEDPSEDRDSDGKPKYMRRVECSVEHKPIDDRWRLEVDGVRVTCLRCGHVETSRGTGEGSVKRCLALMRENCPEGEHNYYVVAEKEIKPDWWSPTPPRGREVETPEILKHRPLKPPGR